MKRLLTIGHSYVVALNRRLAHEMALAGRGEWDVTVAAPESFAGDLGLIALEPIENEAARLVPLRARLQRSPHFMSYAGVRPLLQQPWDVIHCWEEPYILSGWQIAAHAHRGARLIVASFQNVSKRYPPPLNWFERSVLRRADAWIAFGHTVHETLVDRPGYRGLPSRVISPGVDLERFRPDAVARRAIRERLGWDDGVPVIGFVGRLVPAKGVATLTDALARLACPWRALFVGDGPAAARVEALGRAQPGRVHLARGVPHGDVPAYLNAMDLLCAPSESTARWREQFGRVLIEAMACGVPVAASRSGEIPHVLGDAALLLPERDAGAWATAITAVIADEPARRRFAEAGAARVREFALPAVAARHLRFFGEVAGS